MDELWVILKKKLRQDQKKDDGTLIWVSFAPESRLIIDFILEPRKKFVADELIE